MILQIFSKYARKDMSGSVMILQIFSNYARKICQVLS